jgi:hypothetical protein
MTDKPFNPFVDKLSEAELDEVEEAMTGKRRPSPSTVTDEGLVERFFRMQHGPAIPWSTAEIIYEAYSTLHGKSQSIEKLNSRGGFGWKEVEIIFADLQRRYPPKHKALIERSREASGHTALLTFARHNTRTRQRLPLPCPQPQSPCMSCKMQFEVW